MQSELERADECADRTYNHAGRADKRPNRADGSADEGKNRADESPDMRRSVKMRVQTKQERADECADRADKSRHCRRNERADRGAENRCVLERAGESADRDSLQAQKCADRAERKREFRQQKRADECRR